MGDVDLRIPPDASIDTALALKAEHIDAFRTSNPFSMLKGVWDVDMSRSRPLGVSYRNGQLAWLDERFRIPCVKNLEFGQETRYIPPNRESAVRLCLSSEIVAVSTASGKCYAWDIHGTGAPFSIQLPSARVLYLFATGKSLAVVHVPEEASSSSSRVSITTWTLENGRTKSFHIPLRGKRGHRPLSYEVRITLGTLLFFERNRGPPDEVFFTRSTLDGKVIAEGTSGPIHRTFRSGYVSIAAYHPQEGSGWAKSAALMELDQIRIEDEDDRRVRALRRRVVEQSRGVVSLVYDLHKDCFRPSQQFTVAEEHSGQKESHRYFWKDMAFGFCCDTDDQPRSHAYDMKTMSTVKDYRSMLDYDMWKREEEGWGRGRLQSEAFGGQPGHRPIRFIGDEIYMVRVYPKGFTAFCFDKNITMENEYKPFRDWRESLKLDRIQHRDHQDDKVDPLTEENTLEFEKQLTNYKKAVWAQEEDAEQGVAAEGD
ncbi:MAG: hypothetical protein Q9166_000057 [cf. Caloplaca sp. 2 TL-2023]